MKKKSSMKKFKNAKEMDEFLESADLSGDFASRGLLKKPSIKKINLDLPQGIIRQIDQIAKEVGVSRQPLLKVWIHERLKVENVK